MFAEAVGQRNRCDWSVLLPKSSGKRPINVDAASIGSGPSLINIVHFGSHTPNGFSPSLLKIYLSMTCARCLISIHHDGHWQRNVETPAALLRKVSFPNCNDIGMLMQGNTSR